MAFKRTRWIPSSPKVTVRAKDSDTIAYLYASHAGKPAAVIYAGKATKALAHYHWRSEEERAKRVAEIFAGQAARTAQKAKWAAERKEKLANHGFKVGDILRSSWGYEQTNIDYYQVTAVRGSYLELREIAAEAEETGWLQGKSVPVPGKFVGEPFRRLAQPDGVKIESYAYAYKLEPKELPGGAKVYDASSWTAYH